MAGEDHGYNPFDFKHNPAMDELNKIHPEVLRNMFEDKSAPKDPWDISQAEEPGMDMTGAEDPEAWAQRQYSTRIFILEKLHETFPDESPRGLLEVLKWITDLGEPDE